MANEAELVRLKLISPSPEKVDPPIFTGLTVNMNQGLHEIQSLM